LPGVQLHLRILLHIASAEKWAECLMVMSYSVPLE